MSLLRSACAPAGLLFLVSCSRPGPAPVLRMEHEVTPQPVRVGLVTITLNLGDASAKPVAGARVALEADMSHPGMAPVFGNAREVEPGGYQTQLEFGMPGDWVILVHVSLPSGQTLERQFDVRGVRPN